MGKKSADAPDTIGAAKEEGRQSRETARDTTYADRADQYNPFGSLTHGQESYIDPATGQRVTKWTQAQGLSPEMQGLMDQQMGMLSQKGDIQAGMMNRISNEMGSAPDWAQFGEAQGLDYDPTQLRQSAEDAMYGRATSRLDPQYQQQEQAMEIKLRNQGLRAGDEAYDAAMGNFGRAKNDAYEQARMGAVGEGRSEAGQLWNQQLQGTDYANALRDKKLDEYLGKRKFSLGEAQALDPLADTGRMVDTFSGGGA